MKIFHLLFLIILASPAFSQSLHWPAEKAEAQRQWVLFTDALQNQMYSEGLEPFQWLSERAPGLGTALYIKGEKLYQGLIGQADDHREKTAYQRQALSLYDQRMEYFSDEESVMNRKLHAAYQYYRSMPEMYEELLSIFTDAYQERAEKFSGANLIAFMDVMRRYRKVGSTGLSEEEVLSRYEQLSQWLAKQPDTEEKQALLDKLLIATVTLDCPTIREKFGAPFLRDTTNLERARQVLGLALAYHCSSAPYFLTALSVVHRQAPAAGTARTLAKLYEARKDPAIAEGYWREAIKLAPEGAEQAELWLSLAQHHQRNGRKPASRSAAREALQRDPSLNRAYQLIGDLYFSSNEDCKGGQRITQDRAIYWAAYDMYEKAGRQDLMQQARQQFPTVEQIFQEGLEEGDTLRVECWINEVVTVRRRPS